MQWYFGEYTTNDSKDFSSEGRILFKNNTFELITLHFSYAKDFAVSSLYALYFFV